METVIPNLDDIRKTQKRQTRLDSLEECCARCKFWAEFPQQPNPEMFMGACRKYPPKFHLINAANGQSVTAYPQNPDFQWCGEFKHSQNRDTRRQH